MVPLNFCSPPLSSCTGKTVDSDRHGLFDFSSLSIIVQLFLCASLGVEQNKKRTQSYFCVLCLFTEIGEDLVVLLSVFF